MKILYINVYKNSTYLYILMKFKIWLFKKLNFKIKKIYIYIFILLIYPLKQNLTKHKKKK